MSKNTTQRSSGTSNQVSPFKRLLETVMSELYGAESIQEAYDAVVTICQEELGAEAAALFLEDEEGRLLRACAASGYGMNLLNDPKHEGPVTYEKGEGITGHVWETSETVKCDSHEAMVNHEWRIGKYDRRQWQGAVRCNNLLFVALKRGSHVFGVLKVENKKDERGYTSFTSEDVQTMETVGAVMSLAIQPAMESERRIKRANQDEFIASVVQYQTDEVEIFLNLDRRHDEGPIIERDGRTAPRMKIREWFEKNPAAWDELPASVRSRYRDIQSFLGNLPSDGYSTDPEEWPRGLLLSQHEQQLHERHHGYRMLAIQGAGDLTMNLFTIAIVDGELIAPPEERSRARRVGEQQPGTRTVYSCLVKTNRGMGRVAIRDVEVDFLADPPKITLLNSEGLASDLLPTDVAVALSGQPVIRNGRPVDLNGIIGCFPDLRHVFSLPELEGRFFGSGERQKLYFGEAQLHDDPQLLRDALERPVLLNPMYQPGGEPLPLGADVSDTVQRLSQAGYENTLARYPVREGEFRVRGAEIEVFLKPAYYPLTMIGLDRERRVLYLMAISGQSGRFSLTIQQAARLLLDRFGVHDAILIDEGNDVFQKVGDQQPVQLTRRQVRAVIAVGGRN
jgi:hypothetical protein